MDHLTICAKLIHFKQDQDNSTQKKMENKKSRLDGSSLPHSLLRIRLTLLNC